MQNFKQVNALNRDAAREDELERVGKGWQIFADEIYNIALCNCHFISDCLSTGPQHSATDDYVSTFNGDRANGFDFDAGGGLKG